MQNEMITRWDPNGGGRTYQVMYGRDTVRIDVMGHWSSLVHTLWVPCSEWRPSTDTEEN